MWACRACHGELGGVDPGSDLWRHAAKAFHLITREPLQQQHLNIAMVSFGAVWSALAFHFPLLCTSHSPSATQKAFGLACRMSLSCRPPQATRTSLPGRLQP